MHNERLGHGYTERVPDTKQTAEPQLELIVGGDGHISFATCLETPDAAAVLHAMGDQVQRYGVAHASVHFGRAPESDHN